MSQHANYGVRQTVHSKGQMEHFGVVVDDKSCNAGGKQCIITPEGYTIPIHVCDGLPCIDMQTPMDTELDKYPHVFLTTDSPWDPLVPDNEFDEQFYNSIAELLEVKERRDGADPRIDDYGFLRTCEDYELLFGTQGKFIAANANSTVEMQHDVFHNASSSGVTYCDETGTVIHNYVPMTY